ncbi:MAG: amidohydrolase, partial [Dehalococcoidia bacterium]
ACGHISSVNSKALALVGLHEEVADPPGGRFGRDANGRLDGVLYETAQASVQAATSPRPEKLRQGLIEGAKDFLSYGITTIHDAGGHSGDQFKALNELQETKLKLRVYNFAIDFVDPEGYLDDCIEAGMATGLGTPWVKVGACKFVTDGSTSGPTCATRQPYDSNPHDRGIIYYEQDQMDMLYEKAHGAGFQLTAHAVGDRAIEMVITAMERAFSKEPRPDPRPRIEHCALLDVGLIGRIKRMGLVPAAQPVFFHEFGDGYLRDYGTRTRYMFPSRTLLEQGVPVAASSDSPVTTNDPFLGMYEAMTRATSGGQTVYDEETVSLAQAIRMYTRNGAYAAYEEDSKGSLEPGKLADLAVLSSPILNLSAQDVRGLQADMTVVAGEVVFDRGNISG